MRLQLCPSHARRILPRQTQRPIQPPWLEVLLKLRSLMALAAAPLIFSNCGLLSGRCLYELRNVVAEGSLVENNVTIAVAHLVESEQRDYQPDKDFSWQITGETLKGHVTKITLQDGASIRYEFPVEDPSRPALSVGFVRQSEGANINGFWDFLSDRKGTVVITTDLPSRSSVTVPLLNVQSSDWNRPYCS